MSAHSPLRVLQVVLSLNPGGAERVVVETTKRLAPAIAPAVLCLDEKGAWAQELEDAGVPVLELGRRPGFHPCLGYQVARIARRHGARVLHCHQYTPFVYGSIAKLVRPGLRLVFTEHGRLADAFVSRKRRFANRLLTCLPGRYFAVCEDLKRHMVAEGFPERRVDVLHNGIEPGDLPGAAERALARERMGLEEGGFVIGTVARLDPVKDLPTLIEAFHRLRGRNADAVLVVVGDGPERGRLGEVAGDGVHFLGNRRDVRELLAGFDLYVNSSLYEGVSLTIVEAMAAALPVIATRVGGNAEVVTDGATGTFVPARDPEALAAAMRTLEQDRALRRAYGDAGRRVVEERFSIGRMVRRYVEAYG